MEIWSPESVLSHVPPGSKNEKVAEGRHEIKVFCSQDSVDARVSVVHGYYVVVNEFSQIVLVGDRHNCRATLQRRKEYEIVQSHSTCLPAWRLWTSRYLKMYRYRLWGRGSLWHLLIRSHREVLIREAPIWSPMFRLSGG